MKCKVSAMERLRFGCDGKGIRTLICLSGCPLRCKFCANPYTWNSSENSRLYSAEELLDELSVDDVYFRATGGGITFGGGEPLLWAPFIRAFVEKAPSKWNFAMETSLAVPFKSVKTVADLIDVFFVDIKTLDRRTYIKYTGGAVGLAKRNLRRLIKLVGAERVIVRVPLIKGYVDAKQREKTVKKLKRMGATELDLFDYVCK